ADGSGYTVYLKNGAQFDARNGGNHRIFYEPQAVIINAGNNTGLFPADTITFQADGVTSVRLTDEGEQLQCFPNPVSDILTVQCETAFGSAIFMDQLGRVCARHTFAPGETQWQYNVSHLAPGSYIVQLSDGQTTRTTSVIVR